jgi:glycosyltransferase involved in cell wall biosynthesis
MEKITFVIPSRNNLEFLKLSYQSIRNLVHVHDILVLDDYSIDGTKEWLESLNDANLITYYNPGPERIGIVGMFDKGIELARTEIIFAFHADMIAGPNLDTNILKHLKSGVVVSATRIEPPLHPPGPEKITQAWGNEPEDINFNGIINSIGHFEKQNKDKVTEGIFAPWCMYKSDYLAIGGHDELFAPQSKEDSDLFNRFVLNGYNVVQSWDGLVYHFTSRGSRFNKYSGGEAGKDSPEWQYTTNKNARNFIRKWGHFVKHTELMKPIIPHKYNIAFIMNNGNLQLLQALEPWCDRIYTEEVFNVVGRANDYIEMEQDNTKFDLTKRVLIKDENEPYAENDIVVEFDANYLAQEDFNTIQHLSDIITQTCKDVEDFQGEYQLGNLKVTIMNLETHEQELIKL